MGISGFKKLAHWIYGNAGQPYLVPLLYAEQRTQRGPVNERGIEYGYALNELSKLGGIHRVLDVGSGGSSFPHLLSYCGYEVTAIDNMLWGWNEYWNKRQPFNRHFRVQSADITFPRYVPGNFDAITCISTLEHIRQYELAMQNMAWLLRRGGHLILTVPCTNGEYKEDVHGDRKYITQSFTLKQAGDWERYYFGRMINEKYYMGYKGRYWGEGECISPPLPAIGLDEINLGCFHYVKVGE